MSRVTEKTLRLKILSLKTVFMSVSSASVRITGKKEKEGKTVLYQILKQKLIIIRKILLFSV
jgi:hypothetical protein